MKRSRVFLALSLAIVGVFFGTSLFHYGSFFDGTIYATISRNLSEGIGDYWHLHFTTTKHNVFYEHPPLVFWLQSFFFQIFGDLFFVERVYQLTVLGVTSWLLYLLSKQGAEGNDELPFLGVVLWLAMPVVMWSYNNNMLETTLTLFSLLSVYFVVRYIKGNQFIYIVLAVVFLLAAFLSKGFVGLFPLAAPMLYGIAYKKLEVGIRTSIILWLCVVCCAVLTWWLSPEALEGIRAYVMQQVVPSLQNKREVTAGSHWSIVLRLLIELLVPIAFGFVVFAIARIKKITVKWRVSPFVWFLLLVGLSASLPLMVTLKQRDFYILPSLPFFALAFGLTVRPVVEEVMRQYSAVLLKRIEVMFYAASCLGFAYGLMTFGAVSRDHEALELANKLAEELPEHEVVSVPYALVVDYPLVAYAARYGKLNFDHVREHPYKLLLGRHPVPKGYRKVNLGIEGYELYELTAKTDSVN